MCLYSKNIEVVIKNVTTRTSSYAIYTLCLSYEYSYPLHGYVTYTGIRYMARNVLDVLPPLYPTFFQLPLGYAATLFFDGPGSAAVVCSLA